MRDTLLEHTILRVLGNNCRPIHLSTLTSEIDVRIERHELTINDLMDTLRRFEELGLISQTKDLLNYTMWTLTKKGEAALREIDGISDSTRSRQHVFENNLTQKKGEKK